MQDLFARASLIPYLAGISREEARLRIVAGDFGRQYLAPGARRGVLVELARVMAVLGLDDGAVAAAVQRYLAARKTERTPIVSLDPKTVRVRRIVAGRQLEAD